MAEEPYILFKLDGAAYAVPSAAVQQLEMIESITRVPNAPDFVEGIVYLRGQVVPVINLRRRFGLEKIPYDKSARLIVVNLDQRVVALAVDSAREFITVEPDHILPPPESLAGPSIEYLQGIVSQPDRLILVINLQKLLTHQEKETLSAADHKGVFHDEKIME